MKIKVLLADDHTVVREGLRLILESADDIQVVGEAENGRLAVQVAKSVLPDVVVLDIVMPLLNGVEATRQLRKEVPTAKVLVLSSYCDEGTVGQLMEAGAAGYLVKQTAAEDLLTAVRQVAKGKQFFSPCIPRHLVEQHRERLAGSAPPRRANRLTSRETEVLQLIAEGYANKQIADELQISIKTVEKHRQQVMHKLNLHEVAGLTRYAMAQGIIEAASARQILNPAGASG